MMTSVRPIEGDSIRTLRFSPNLPQLPGYAYCQDVCPRHWILFQDYVAGLIYLRLMKSYDGRLSRTFWNNHFDEPAFYQSIQYSELLLTRGLRFSPKCTIIVGWRSCYGLGWRFSLVGVNQGYASKCLECNPTLEILTLLQELHLVSGRRQQDDFEWYWFALGLSHSQELWLTCVLETGEHYDLVQQIGSSLLEYNYCLSSWL